MPKRGEKHHNARLTDAQVEDMRNLFESWKKAGSKKGYGTIAKIFCCSASTARDIVQYRTR